MKELIIFEILKCFHYFSINVNVIVNHTNNAHKFCACDYSIFHHNRTSHKSLMVGSCLVLMLKGYLWCWIWTGILPPWASIRVVYAKKRRCDFWNRSWGQEGSITTLYKVILFFCQLIHFYTPFTFVIFLHWTIHSPISNLEYIH